MISVIQRPQHASNITEATTIMHLDRMRITHQETPTIATEAIMAIETMEMHPMLETEIIDQWGKIETITIRYVKISDFGNPLEFVASVSFLGYYGGIVFFFIAAKL